MGISLDVDYVVSKSSVDAELANLDRLLSPLMLTAFLEGTVVQHFQEQIEGFFRAQGTPQTGGWLPLSEAAVSERQSMGLGKTPINVRTGGMKYFLTTSHGDVKTLAASVFLTFPGRTSGELAKKVKTAQKGGKYKGHLVPSRPVIEADESDFLFVMSALSFYLGAGR